MANSVALIDYGAGNLHSVENALRAVGADVSVTADPALVRTADRIVLPGVGSFKACAEGLKAIDGLVDALSDRVLTGRVPFLGICVGMQLLATRGLEHGETAGLGWIPGDVRLIEQTDPAIKVPHMGWNDVALTTHAPAHYLLEEGEAYFLHSYHFAASDPHHSAAMTYHGGGLGAAGERDKNVGRQCKPPKSKT